MIRKQIYVIIIIALCILITLISKSEYVTVVKGGSSDILPVLTSSQEAPSETYLKYQSGWAADEDPNFLKYIFNNWIIHPGNNKQNIPKGNTERHFSQIGQSKLVDKLLNHKTSGFFIECGAGNGMSLSNSLFFELYRNWSGLLIEPNPLFFSQIIKLNRTAYLTNICLSTTNTSLVVKFRLMDTLSGIEGLVPNDTLNMAKYKYHVYSKNVIDVQCFTLHSLLLAIDQTEIDYFSLDVEGPELDILESIPFDKISIKILTIEYAFMGNPAKSRKKLDKIRSFFSKLGNYKEVKIISGQDVVFMKI